MYAIEQHATMDFETYSDAGFQWNEDGKKWDALAGCSKQKKGISAVGSAAYAEHPSTEVLTLSWKLPGDNAVTRWTPGQALPQRLFDYIASGGIVEAHNSMFERFIWHYVCRRRYGWPEAPGERSWRCSAAKARVNNLPGALDNLTEVLDTTIKKNADGKRLINKFSVPQKPTKKQPATRILFSDDPADAENMMKYCDDDIYAEEEASRLTFPMSRDELEFWFIDQEINFNGIAVDRSGVRDMVAVLEQTLSQYGEECMVITGGFGPSQVQKLQGWLQAKGVALEKMDEEHIDEALKRKDLPADCRRVLEIRALAGSASVKKLYAMERTASNDNRVRNIIIHHGARTGRPTGDLVQPLNLPKAGPDLIWCEACGCPSKVPEKTRNGLPLPPQPCPWCLASLPMAPKKYKWGDLPKGMDGVPHIEYVLQIMATRSLDVVEHFFGDALLAISGCVRGMFVAGPGKDLIASDYSAIEAVVTAALSGCKWRMDTFREMKDIYLVSAAKITGNTYEFYKAYQAENGSHHPDRQKIGKVAELALGFGGWLGAWLQFDPDGAEDFIKQNIVAWRKASPEIVEMWGGQERGRPGRDGYRLERFGFEGAFTNAVQYPGQMFETHGIKFYTRGDSLIIRLLSGRELVYHSPRLFPSTRDYVGEGVLEITYMTWNSNPKYGPPGWGPMKTYAGRLAENIVQATAHDIQRYGIINLRAAGYPTVLHVYDENVAEVLEGFGSIEEFEAIMATMPPWAHDWPIRASGGWRGKRYRKG